MFGLPFLGGGGGGLGGIMGMIPIYAILFGINLVVQLVFGGLGDIFAPATPA